MNKAEQDVLAERQRQIDVEGWTPEHDDEYVDEDLAMAASCYCMYVKGQDLKGSWSPSDWPWEHIWWKPTSYRQNIVKAGALIIAEIERLDRQ